ncbi:DUF4234 domain-containing protein [bacterium]|nr:DUF4234 domain-containing protein [bacterium]
MSGFEQETLDSVAGIYEEHFCSVPKYLIFTLLTCGVFNLYWNYRQMKACNDLLDEDEFSFWPWLLLTIITCGIYHIYYQYKMGRSIVEIQRKEGKREFEILPVISVVVTLFGLSIVVDCIHQLEINKLVE